MEDSAFEAIYTGVYIFIFIAALTMTLYMFKNVNELAERSYEYGIVATGDRLIEATEEPDKILDKSDIISYYYNYVNIDNYEDNYETYLKISKIKELNSELSYNGLIQNLNDNNYSIQVNESKNNFKIIGNE